MTPQIRRDFEATSITLPIGLLDEYKKHARLNGMTISGRIAVLIKKDIEVLKNK